MLIPRVTTALVAVVATPHFCRSWPKRPTRMGSPYFVEAKMNESRDVMNVAGKAVIVQSVQALVLLYHPMQY